MIWLRPPRPRAEPRRRSYIFMFLRGVLFAQFILFATWNNSGYSYLSWLSREQHVTPLMAVTGIALLIAYVVLFRIAFVALGYRGLVAASMLLSGGLLILWQLGLIDLEALTSRIEFWLFVVAAILSIGLGWGAFQQRISGQNDVLKRPP